MDIKHPSSVNYGLFWTKLSEIVDKHKISYLRPELEWGPHGQRENTNENLLFFKIIELKLNPTKMNRIES